MYTKTYITFCFNNSNTSYLEIFLTLAYKAQWLLYVPDTVLACFVWLSQQTASASLNSINRLVVRYKFLNIIYMSYILPSPSRIPVVLLGPSASVSVGTRTPTLSLRAAHVVTSKCRSNAAPRVLIRCYRETVGITEKTMENQQSGQQCLGWNSNRAPLEPHRYDSLLDPICEFPNPSRSTSASSTAASYTHLIHRR
jgi:hypothetical protein